MIVHKAALSTALLDTYLLHTHVSYVRLGTHNLKATVSVLLSVAGVRSIDTTHDVRRYASSCVHLCAPHITSFATHAPLQR